MKKICNVVLSLLIITTLLPHRVHAGVVKELVEVDEAQRILDEQERIRRQEEYKKEAIEQSQAKSQPQPEPEVIAPAKTVIETPVVPVVNSCTVCEKVRNVLGAVVAVPVATIVGLVRGSASKGVDMSDTFTDALGDGAMARTAGVSGGVIVGGVSGAATGLVDGAITGAVTGWRHPFTRESFLLDGPFLDYDPYELGAE